ncbi:hypothetical protein L6164_028542 [Bauhinia variegata]|uniref:Uncharacterized protein n=1 Tax=Bauhinia variegata TaxID=167791 RepID=A0ACB9L605_BAUVA|nr:hypothetical protein L6164_028542 [Bauhinia variegata]
MGFVTKSGEVTQNSNWSNLTRDIAESILKRLCLQDYLQFGAVCKSWQTIVIDTIETKQCLPARLAQLPVMIASRAENGLVASNASIDPNSSPFFFLNTVSNVRVNLPSALTIPQQVNSDNIPFDKMVASSSPSSKDCFIAGRFEDFQHIAFCMLGDKSWTIIK